MGNRHPDLERANIFTGQGTPGRILSRRTAVELSDLGLDATIAAADAADHNRANDAHHPPLHMPGVASLALPSDEIEYAYGHLGDDHRAEAARSRWSSAVGRGNQAHIGVVRNNGLRAPFCIYYFGYSGGHKILAVSDLEDRHIRLPDELTLACCILPHEFALRDKVRLDAWMPVALKDSGAVEATVLFDNLSPIAVRWGRPMQDRLITQAFAGLIASIWQFANMRSAADVAATLGLYSPFLGWSFGLRPLLPGAERPAWYRVYRGVSGGPARGSGNVQDTVIQTIEATKDALCNSAWRTVQDPPSPGMPAFLVIREPYKLGKPRDLKVWQEVIAPVEDWLQQTYPWVTALWVSGDSPANPESAPSPYNVLCSLLYPLPERPTAVQSILETPSLLRLRRGTGKSSTVVQEVPVNHNGRTPHPETHLYTLRNGRNGHLLKGASS